MFRSPDPELRDDPIVRATVARLRASLIAATGASIAFLILGLVAIAIAWQAGMQQGATKGIQVEDAFPSVGTVGLLVVGFIALGITLIIVVRAPFDRAREQSIDLVTTNKKLTDTTLEAFAALGAAVEAKDRYTAGHSLRVTLISILIGQELGMSQSDLDTLRYAATFHDIGKIAVPDHVLNKRGRLTDSDFEAMKLHPVEGAHICSKLQSLHDAIPLIRHHHERVDGRGYPDCLSGDDIPLGSRVIAVADAWDAITSDRPYREGQPAFIALEEIRHCMGTQFDNHVVHAFIEVLARDPWMFGLTPEDVAARRPLPAPLPASRGVDYDGDNYSDDRKRSGGLITHMNDDVDWSNGFDQENQQAA